MSLEAAGKDKRCGAEAGGFPGAGELGGAGEAESWLFPLMGLGPS